MKNNRLVILCISLGLVLLALPVLEVSGQPTPPPTTKPVVLKLLTFSTSTDPAQAGLRLYMDRIKEKSKGKLTIQLVGGPEAVGRGDQPEALRMGVIDMLYHFTAIWEDRAPELRVWGLSELTPHGGT